MPPRYRTRLQWPTNSTLVFAQRAGLRSSKSERPIGHSLFFVMKGIYIRKGHSNIVAGATSSPEPPRPLNSSAAARPGVNPADEQGFSLYPYRKCSIQDHIIPLSTGPARKGRVNTFPSSRLLTLFVIARLPKTVINRFSASEC
jgi:hypothetical protein